MTCQLVNVICEEFVFNIFNTFFEISAQKPWSETDTQFPYSAISGEDNLISKTVPSTISSHLPQPPVTTQQDTSYSEYQDANYEQYDDTSYQQYDEQQYNQQYNKQEQYLDQYQDQTDFQQQSYDYQYQYQEDQQKQQYGEEHYHDQQDYYEQNQYQQQQQQEFQKQQQQFEQQKQHQQQQLQLQQQQKFQQQQQQLQQQQLQQQQQKQQPAQQLQTTVLTGAATLGSIMAGGAKKLGSFFGAAAAAVAPAISQPPAHVPATTAPVSHYTSAVAPVTPFTSITSVQIASVPEVSPSVSASATTTAPVALPRTPSLKRQESIQRPPVRRTRTLPEAPDDLPPSSYESAYEDDYQKTDSDQLLERDRTSLDRYHDDDQYLHETIPEEVTEEEHLHDQTSPGRQKTSPTRTVTQITRKPSVDSYNSQVPSIIDRKPSQSSFHLEDQHAVPTTQEGKCCNCSVMHVIGY